jgi:H+/Cl- antiporter ClcA
MKTGSLVAMIFVCAVGALHVVRLIFGISIVVGDVNIPQWASLLAVIGMGLIAGLLWRERAST